MINQVTRGSNAVLLAGSLLFLTGCTGIHVNSVPPGGTVFIDGKATDLRTPTKVRMTQLSRGAHTIDVRKEGHQTITQPRRIEVATSKERIAMSVLIPPLLFFEPFDGQWKGANPPSALPPFYLTRSGCSLTSSATLEQASVLNIYRPDKMRGKALALKVTVRDISGDEIRSCILGAGQSFSLECTEALLTLDAATVAPTSMDAAPAYNTVTSLKLTSGEPHYVSVLPLKGGIRAMAEEEGHREFLRCNLIAQW